MNVPEEVRFRDFTRKRPPVSFTVGGYRFDCVKALSPTKLQEFIKTTRRSETDESNVIDRVSAAMKLIIVPDHYPRFEELLRDDDDPVDLDQLAEIISWVLEIYGARPTQPSSDSSSSSANAETGTPSTAGALLEI